MEVRNEVLKIRGLSISSPVLTVVAKEQFCAGGARESYNSMGVDDGFGGGWDVQVLH